MRNNKDNCPKCGNLKTKGYIQCRACKDSAKGADHPAWKGGRILDGDGYIRVYRPEDPRANCGRYMKEHTLVMESILGRQLLAGENVHHKNGVKTDNRSENLELWVKHQPAGQRPEDLVIWAREILRRYA